MVSHGTKWIGREEENSSPFKNNFRDNPLFGYSYIPTKLYSVNAVFDT
jgi:hypothetical protein